MKLPSFITSCMVGRGQAWVIAQKAGAEDALGDLPWGWHYCTDTHGKHVVVTSFGTVRSADWREKTYLGYRRVRDFLKSLKYYKIELATVDGRYGIQIRDTRPSFDDILQDIMNTCMGRPTAFL